MAKPLLPALLDLVRTRVERAVAPAIHDDGDERCLRFSNGVVQSAMRLSDPVALELSYTRALMGFLLFHPEPRHILAVGLGGGSLPKFCYHALPQTQVTALEIDPAVIALRGAFRIPPDDARFRVIATDARGYIGHDDAQADVIILDAYDAIGLPGSLCTESFYNDCRQALGGRGVLAANLWGGEPKRALYLERLRRVFDDRVWWCQPPDSSSLVIFATGDATPAPPWSHILAAARALDARWNLGLAALVSALRARPDPGP